MRVNEQFKYLNIGLPDRIARKKTFGDFQGAVRMIDDELAAGKGSPAYQACLRVQRELILRLARDYPYTFEEAVAFAQKSVPDFTPQEMEELERTGLAPYRTLCREKAAGAVMTAHILFPQIEPGVPATMSPEILTGILRRDIGFDGIVFSDGIQMKAIADHYGMERGCIAAIRAGVDVVCIGTGGSGSQDAQISCMEALYQAALSGEIPMARIDEAVAHVLAGKAVYCNRPAQPAPDYAAHAALNAEVCRRAVTRLSGGTVSGRVLYASAPGRDLAFGLTHADPRQLTFGQMAAMHTGCAYTTLDRLDKAGDYDALVIGMQQVREDSIELAAAQQAYAQGKQVALVLMNTPYGAQHLPKAYSVVCSYSHTPAAVAAAIDVLTGKAQPTGSLPVTLE